MRYSPPDRTNLCGKGILKRHFYKNYRRFDVCVALFLTVLVVNIGARGFPDPIGGFYPIIIDQPRSVSALPGGKATFRVDANDGPWTYQWYRNGLALRGGTTNELKIANVSTTDFGKYTVEVRGQNPIMSEPAMLVQAQLKTLTIHPAVEIESFFDVGKYYQVQFSENLETWQDDGRPFAGDGQTNFVLKTSRHPSGGFFRIKQTDLIPGAPPTFAGKNYAFTSRGGLLELVEFSAVTNTFDIWTFSGVGRVGNNGSAAFDVDDYGRPTGKLVFGSIVTGGIDHYDMIFHGTNSGSLDLTTVKTNCGTFVEIGIGTPPASLDGRALNMNIAMGPNPLGPRYPISLTFNGSSYTGVFGSQAIHGTFTYSYDGVVTGLELISGDLGVSDFYALVFTSQTNVLVSASLLTLGPTTTATGTGVLSP